MEDWKTKLSVLWLLSAVSGVSFLVLALFEPGALEQVMAGEIGGIKITPELMLLFAIVFLAPLVMAFLSLTLKDAANRWANIIVGAVFIIIPIIPLISTLENQSVVAINPAFGSVCGALIVWYAWKSKQ